MMSENTIFCCSPKAWTRAVGGLGIIGIVYYGVQIPLGMNQFVHVLNEMGKVDEAEALDYGRTGVAVSVWVSCAIAALVDVLLVVGNEKERRGFILPWLILTWIGTILCGILFVIGLATGFFAAVFVLLIACIFEGLFLYVVHRRYAEIKGKSVNEVDASTQPQKIPEPDMDLPQVV